MSDNQDQTDTGSPLEQGVPSNASTSSPHLDEVGGNVLGGLADAVPLENLGAISTSKALIPSNVSGTLTLNSMLDVPVPLVFEVGRTKITIAHLMEMKEGSFIDLRNVSVDVIDVRVNEQIVAEAEAISLQQRYGVRISEITRLPSSEDGDDAA